MAAQNPILIANKAPFAGGLWLSLWHFALAAVSLAAGIGILGLGLPLLAQLAMGILCLVATLAGLCFLSGSHKLSVIISILWALGAGAAICLTGGRLSPLLPLCVMPALIGLGTHNRAGLLVGVGLGIAALLGGDYAHAFVRPEALSVWQQGQMAQAVMVVLITLLGALGWAYLKRQEQMATQSDSERARLQALLSEQPGLVLRFDATGWVLSAYGTAPKGIESERLLGHGLMPCVAEADQDAVREAFFFVARDGFARVRFAPLDALDRACVLLLRQVRDRGRESTIFGHIFDITLEQSRLDTLEAEHSENVKALSLRSQRFANISHEIRTALNAVIGFSDSMRQRFFGPLEGRYHDYSQLIFESGHHALDLVNDAINLSRIEEQGYELRLSAFDGREPLSQAIRMMRATAHQKSIVLKGFLPTRAVTLEADKRAIKQIALNLLSNALKFTKAGGQVTLKARPVGDQFEISVADTGQGMSEDDLKRIGQRYEQAGSDADRAKGSGLGLSIVKDMVAQHGGDMQIKSALGQGTTITVKIPFRAKGQPDLPFSV